ncbi:MAG: porin [Planctomycetota bacterium]|nr:porin [Planctomycetota bacterium]
MNKFLYTAIALTAASSTSFATDSDWLELDQDIASLSSNVASADGATIGALLRTSYRDGGTLGGFTSDDLDLWFEGSLEEFSYRVSFDITSGTALLEDAYVSWNCGDDMDVIWGQFKVPVLRSSTMDSENMLFIDRSNLGALYDIYDTGAGVMGNFEGFNYTFAAQNGSDGSTEDLLLFGHASYNIGAGLSSNEGAMKSGDELDGVIGVSYMDFENDSVDAVLAIDLAMTMGQISGSLELADGSDDVIGASMGTNPLALTLGYLFADNMEAAYRYEDYDNAADDSKSTFGFNWYLHGHNAKWQINYIDDDLSTDEVIAVGLTVGASR